MSSTGRKVTGKEQEEDPEELSGESATSFRALAARANFLAIDRPDISFAVKELCRGMARPTKHDEVAPKRVARYLLGKPRMILHFGWQKRPRGATVMTDIHWAGCLKTRKSTSGGVTMRGAHALRLWSTTQATVALSSAEAERFRIVKGASEAIGARGLLEDFGVPCAIDVCTDASAAVGACKRTGVGRIRHFDTRLLWIQDKIRAKEIVLSRTPWVENPANLMTKYLSGEAVSGHLARIGCWPREWRAESAPDL